MLTLLLTAQMMWDAHADRVRPALVRMGMPECIAKLILGEEDARMATGPLVGGSTWCVYANSRMTVTYSRGQVVAVTRK